MLYWHAGFPLMLVVILVLAWLTLSKVNSYVDERDRISAQISQMAQGLESSQSERIHEVEFIHDERMEALNQRFLKDLCIAAAILLVALGVPLMATRHVSNILQDNLNLLNQRMASGGREGSALMPQAFDLEEFDPIVETMHQAVLMRSESEQRWKRAEKKLVAANNDLMKRAEELRNGRKVALSMMEDAEMAREQLEQVNERLSVVLEHAEQSAKDADIANKAKSDFLATMSHEIRTPLNGVIGFIEMLSDTKLDTEQKEYAQTVRSSGEALMALINDVLDFSKIESGHLFLEQREFNFLRMLQDLTSVFFGQAARKSLHLEIEIQDDVPHYVLGDETRIRQILTNLLANAIKFTAEGEVRLVVEKYSGPNAEGIAEIEFEIRDSGIGMNKEQLQSLFRPFSQGDSSTTRKFGGTGLGLAISKRLAEAMGGRIWAISKEDKGSSFFTRIQLKLAEKKDEPKSASVAVGQNGDSPNKDGEQLKPGEAHPLRIAVAEDNSANQRVLMIMLKRLGWQDVSFSLNGEELIEFLKTNPVDLIFMDLQMPVMDGIEATTLIRAGEAGPESSKAKIIALTANALQGDADHCLSVGMDAYMSKPIKLDVLRETVLDQIGVKA